MHHTYYCYTAGVRQEEDFTKLVTSPRLLFIVSQPKGISATRYIAINQQLIIGSYMMKYCRGPASHHRSVRRLLPSQASRECQLHTLCDAMRHTYAFPSTLADFTMIFT